MISILMIVSAALVVTVVHEFGHFVVAKLVGVPVVRLGVGFGPTLWSTRLGDETELQVRSIPLGMSIGVPGRRDPDGTPRRSVKCDLAVAAAGPAISIALTLILLVVAVLSPGDSWWFTWLVGTALLSALVAALNLMPAPGSDGGHLVVLMAASLGWQLSPQSEVRLHKSDST